MSSVGRWGQDRRSQCCFQIKAPSSRKLEAERQGNEGVTEAPQAPLRQEGAAPLGHRQTHGHPRPRRRHQRPRPSCGGFRDAAPAALPRAPAAAPGCECLSQTPAPHSLTPTVQPAPSPLPQPRQTKENTEPADVRRANTQTKMEIGHNLSLFVLTRQLQV